MNDDEEMLLGLWRLFKQCDKEVSRAKLHTFHYLELFDDGSGALHAGTVEEVVSWNRLSIGITKLQRYLKETP